MSADFDNFRAELDGTPLAGREAVWVRWIERTDLEAFVRDNPNLTMVRPGDSLVWTPELILHASTSEEVEILREHGAPWDHRFMERMAEEAKLDCLQYGVDNYAPIRDAFFDSAVRGGSGVIEWVRCEIRNTGWPCGLATAAETGDYDLYRLVEPLCKPLSADEAAAAVRRAQHMDCDLVARLRRDHWMSFDFHLCLYATGHLELETLVKKFAISGHVREILEAGIARGDPAINEHSPWAVPAMEAMGFQLESNAQVSDDPEVVARAWEFIKMHGASKLRQINRGNFELLVKHANADESQLCVSEIVRRADVALVENAPRPIQQSVLEVVCADPDSSRNIMAWFCEQVRWEDSVYVSAQGNLELCAWLGTNGYHKLMPRVVA